MSTYIDIHLVNFKCWLNNTFRLVKGVNLFTGKSGTGKSTVCKAIYFVLYGGRKHKKITNRKHPTGKTEVTFTFISPNLQYKIVRSRPSETLYVNLVDSTGIYEIRDKAAQAWIDTQFGIENDWLASSYISRKHQHFLLESSNTDKMKLLQHMSFGEEVARNQPDTYLIPTKTLITQYNDSMKLCNEEIKMKQTIRASIISRNPIIETHPFISKEQHEIIVKTNLELVTKLDRMRFSMKMMESKKELKTKLESLELFEETVESIDSKCSTIANQSLKYQLTNKLKDFDTDILTFDERKLESDGYLYSKYLAAGWREDYPLIDFINASKKELAIYESQLKLEEKNLRIKKSNLERDDLNKALRRAYLKQKSDYDKIVEEIEVYERKKISLTEVYNNLVKDVHTKFSSIDDLSSGWLIGYKIGIEMCLKELICPNCNHGLIYENGRLQMGTLDGTIEGGCESIRKKQNENLSLANLEYEKRVLREKIITEYEHFSKIIPRVKPDLPEEPKFYELEELIPVKLIKKPLLDVFELPSIDYTKYKSLKESKLVKNYYEHLCTLKDYELVDDLDKILKEHERLKALKQRIIKVDEEKRSISNLIETLPNENPEIYTEICELEKLISENTKLIEISNIFREIELIDSQLVNLEASVKNAIGSLEYLDYFYSEIENLATETLLTKLNELNGPISVILSDLFNHPLSIELSPYKTLKTGDTKTQINFNVVFKGIPIDSTDEFSDGEEGRLSLALLIAFSRINKNPFVIIDEILSSVNLESQNDCLDIINKWTADKFVINICHNVAEGHHSNVIHFPEIIE